ncbi:hypothetical protein D3C72_2146360 [compost metagenome]
MTDQLFWIWPRNASISLWLSSEPPVVFLPPKAALSGDALAPPAVGSFLFRRAATSSALKSLSLADFDFAVSWVLTSFFLFSAFAVSLWVGLVSAGLMPVSLMM